MSELKLVLVRTDFGSGQKIFKIFKLFRPETKSVLIRTDFSSDTGGLRTSMVSTEPKGSPAQSYTMIDTSLEI